MRPMLLSRSSYALVDSIMGTYLLAGHAGGAVAALEEGGAASDTWLEELAAHNLPWHLYDRRQRCEGQHDMRSRRKG